MESGGGGVGRKYIWNRVSGLDISVAAASVIVPANADVSDAGRVPTNIGFCPGFCCDPNRFTGGFVVLIVLVFSEPLAPLNV